MEVCQIEERFVERDLDLVRKLLLNLAAEKNLNGKQWLRYHTPDELKVSEYSTEVIAYHLNLLIDEGFLVGNGKRAGIPLINNMTWKGHELLDDIRDETVWGNTKERIKGLSSVGVSLVWEIAKAELKKRLNLPPS
jgi:hypothetical protein